MIKQIQQITYVDLEDTDIESLFSEEDEPLPESIFAVCHVETFDHSESDDDEPLQFSLDKIFSLVQEEQLVPLITPQIYLTTFSKPIKVIALIDNRVRTTILNPEVLPADCQ